MTIRRRLKFAHLYLVMNDAVGIPILPQILGFALYSMFVLFVARQYHLNLSIFNTTPLVLAGVTLWIYLLFRNNAAYDRWRETRKVAGTLIPEIRNLARATTTLVPERSEQRALLMEALAFCHFLRGQLSKTDSTKDAAAFVDTEADTAAKCANPADEMIRRMRMRTNPHSGSGAVDSIGFRILDERLATISAIQTNCERIAGTRLPFAHALLVHRMAYIVCLLLPIALISAAGWATPLFMAMIAYTFFGLDVLLEELEHPFGATSYDLGLDGLCNVCEISVFEALGETPPKIVTTEAK